MDKPTTQDDNFLLEGLKIKADLLALIVRINRRNDFQVQRMPSSGLMRAYSEMSQWESASELHFVAPATTDEKPGEAA